MIDFAKLDNFNIISVRYPFIGSDDINDETRCHWKDWVEAGRDALY